MGTLQIPQTLPWGASQGVPAATGYQADAPAYYVRGRRE
jgi:hypothetical protein